MHSAFSGGIFFGVMLCYYELVNKGTNMGTSHKRNAINLPL
jgi:hypothetical protein